MENKLILIVDDEQDIVGEMSAFLSSEGYSTIVANNGETALKLFKTRNPVLVITDYNMPVMNGIDLLRQIKLMNSMIHVVLVSGVADRKIIVTAMKEAAFDFLLKPIDVDDLLMVVRAAISKTLVNTSSREKTQAHGYIIPYDDSKGRIATTILHFYKDIDEYSVGKYNQDTTKLLQEGLMKNNVIINMNNVNFINSRGLDYLISLKEKMEEKGHKLFLVQLNNQVDNYIKSLGYDKFFSIEQTVDGVYKHLNL
jgi:anti-anti-sigma factor